MIRFLQTPSATKKIVFWGILLVICGAMVITLIPGGFLGDAFGTGSPGVLAKVGNQEITTAEAQQLARQMLQRYGAGGQMSALLPMVLPQAVESLVVQKIALVEAERMGLRVDNSEMADWLQHGPFAKELFPNGQFIGQDRYEQFTEQAFNRTIPQFEREVKAQLLLTKLQSVVEGSVMVSDGELRQQYVHKNTKIKFEYAVLTTDDVMKQLHPTDAELKAYYDKNLKVYENSIPEKRRVQYVAIDTAKLRDKVQVTPADVKNYYSANLDQYRVLEEVKVRHILIKTPPPGADGKVDPKAVEAARAKAEDIMKKIRAGGNFAELAKKFSDDAGSAPAGGELGWIGRGRTVPEFEKAAFSLPVGQTSDLVQSSYGFHILQVEDKHTAHVKPLEEVKSQIESLVAQQKAETLAENLARTVENSARTAGLASAAAKNGLEVMTSSPVSKSDSLAGVGNTPEFMSAVFNAPDKNPPETVHLPAGYAVFQVLEVVPPSTPSFAEAKSRVEADFKRERATQDLQQKLQELSDRARAQHDLKKAAGEVGATLHTSELVGPESQVPEIGALTGPASALFDLKVGDISAPIPSGRGGAVALLLDRQEPPAGGFDAQKDQIRESLLAQKRAQTYRLFIEGLQQRMEKEGKIQLYKKEMERLLPKSEAS
jgi:peptidyl-prolyl cis-trans isomerase D